MFKILFLTTFISTKTLHGPIWNIRVKFWFFKIKIRVRIWKMLVTPEEKRLIMEGPGRLIMKINVVWNLISDNFNSNYKAARWNLMELFFSSLMNKLKLRIIWAKKILTTPNNNCAKFHAWIKKCSVLALSSPLYKLFGNVAISVIFRSFFIITFDWKGKILIPKVSSERSSLNLSEYTDRIKK